MSKTNVQKTAEELYTASATLVEKVKNTRMSTLNQLNVLRDLETRIKNQIKEEQMRAREAIEAEAQAQAEVETLEVPLPEAEEMQPVQQTPAVENKEPVVPEVPQKEEPVVPEEPAASQPVEAPAENKAKQEPAVKPARGHDEPRQAPPRRERSDQERQRAMPVQDQQRPAAPRQPRQGGMQPGARQSGTPAMRQYGAPAARQGGTQSAARQGGAQSYPPRREGAASYPRREGGAAPRTGQDQRRGPYPPRQAGQDQTRREGYAPRPGAAGAAGPPRGRRPGAPAGRAADPLNPKSLAKELAPVQEKERASNYNPNKKAFVREKDVSSSRVKKNKKQLLRDQAPSLNDDDMRFRKKRRRQQISRGIEKKIIDHAVITTEMVPIKVLAERIGITGAEILKKLMLLGVMTSINQEIDYDTASLVASEFNVTLEKKLDKTFEEVMMDSFEEDDEDNQEERPPVVTIMGHVDHGKTSLLDVIRKSHVTETEAGGITQHIGAYMIEVEGRAITFLDTPGHEAFTAMRSRGAQVTDIAILVVAADDGVMPQTIEAINHAKAAKVPIIVAINKMDLPAANPDRVKQELMEYGLVPEEWGGENMMVEVSAQTHAGIDKLLESILLLAEIEDLTANPEAKATGTVIEAKLDRGRGPVATVLINNGTLRVGDTIVAGTTSGRIRDMFDDAGNHVDEATPSMPVEIVGFSQVPEAGDILHSAEGDKLARRVAQERQEKIKIERMKAASKVTLDDLFTKISEGEMKTLSIVIRGDVQGSVEAVKQALEKLSNDDVRIQCIHDGVGAITENDIMLASASDAIVIGFNVRPDVNGRLAAEREKVDIRLYRVIYNAVEDMQKAIKGMLAPEFKEMVLGHAQVRDLFHISGVGTIAGGYVTDGLIRRNAKVRVLRDSVVVHEGTLSSLKRFKDDVREVASGYECGIGVSGFNDIKENDVIEAFVMEEIKR